MIAPKLNCNQYKTEGFIQKARNGKNCLFDPHPHVTACHVPVAIPSSLRNILARHPPPLHEAHRSVPVWYSIRKTKIKYNMIYYCYYPILCTFVRYKSFVCTHTRKAETKNNSRIIQSSGFILERSFFA